MKEHVLWNDIFRDPDLLSELKEKYGTPVFLYSSAILEKQLTETKNALKDQFEIYFAMKANPNLELLKFMREHVNGLDISSGGELKQALNAGYSANSVSFAGPAKTLKELELAIKVGTGSINVENVSELKRIIKLSKTLQIKSNIVVRVNPLKRYAAFPIRMGGVASQFGIDEEDIPSVIGMIKEHREDIEFRGIHVYAGTNSFDATGVANSIKDIIKIASVFEKEGFACHEINIGGGFGCSYYDASKEFSVEEFGSIANPIVSQYRQDISHPVKFIVELGRFLVSSSGLYLAKVIALKETRESRFVILDGGMNHHLAASGNLGQFRRKNYLLSNLSNQDAKKIKCNVVGPLCTPIDLMGFNVELEAVSYTHLTLPTICSV